MNRLRATGICLAVVLLMIENSAAQEQRASPVVPAQGVSPYAGMQSRPVKALSDQQIADLKAGRGMSLALVAELNGYPGPLHSLELADRLELSQALRAQIATLFAEMKAEAVLLGEQLIGQEAGLDQLFQQRTITPATLALETEAIGKTQAALRNAHLRYHLATVELMTPEQIHRYGALRGYGAAGTHLPGRH